MKLLTKKFNASTLFAQIIWDEQTEMWRSASYRESIQSGEALDTPARLVQLDSISPKSRLFKASVERVTVDRSRARDGGVDLAIEWLSRDQKVRTIISYCNVALMQSSGFRDFLVGGELLGHELTATNQGWRHALLFIASEYALVEAREITWQQCDSEPLGEA